MNAVGGRHLCLLLLAAVVAACACGGSHDSKASQASAGVPGEIRVKVTSVGFDQTSGGHYVLLWDDSESRELPIMVGDNEAQAIMLALHGIRPERPLTHNLLQSVIEQTGNRVDRILIAEVRNGIYYAKIYLDQGRYSIDCRPSDAIALATGANAPIYVQDRLFDLSPAPGERLVVVGKLPATAHALGITVEQLTPELASYFGASIQGGVLVSDVDRAAKKAGVTPGDIVLKVADHQIKALDDFSERMSAVSRGGVRLTLSRDGASRTVTVEGQVNGRQPR